MVRFKQGRHEGTRGSQCPWEESLGGAEKSQQCRK